MAATGILQVHENITLSRGHYCSVCFRSGSERRLVEPVHFKKFISNMKNVIPFRAELKVCYICESLAASAERFFKSAQLAARVGQLCNDINTRGQWSEVIKYMMEDELRGASYETKVLVKRAAIVDGLLRSAPGLQLRRTETLVVDNASHKRRPILETDDVVIIDGDEPLPAGGGAPRPPPPPAAGRPPPPPPAPPALRGRPALVSVVPDMQNVQVVDRATNDIFIHPIVKGPDGSMYVPSLHLNVPNNGSSTSTPNRQQTTVPAHVRNPHATDSHTNMLHNLLADSKQNNNTRNKQKILNKVDERADYFNFIRSQKHEKSLNEVNNVEIIKANSVNIILRSDEGSSKKMRMEDPLKLNCESNLSDVQQILNEYAKGDCDIKFITDDDDPAADGGRPARRPVPRTDRSVDWEDKIPMDVISFMDATDPNPSERIMQPPRPTGMGFISDVRSLPEPPAKPRHDRNVECIDLR